MSNPSNDFEPPPTLEAETLRQRLALVLIVATSCTPALNMTGFLPFWPDMPLLLALFVSLIGGVVGGMMYAPRGTNCLLGVLPGLMAGPGAMLLTYFYTSSRETLYRVEGALVCLIGILPGALLYWMLLKLFYGRPRRRPQPLPQQAWHPQAAARMPAAPQYAPQQWPPAQEAATDVEPLPEQPVEIIPATVVPVAPAKRGGGIWWFAGVVAVGVLLWLGSRGGGDKNRGAAPSKANVGPAPITAQPVPIQSKPALVPVDIPQALSDLASGQSLKVRSAADRLATAKVIEAERKEVADALAAHLERGDIFERRAVVAALRHWGEDEHLTLLVERLNDPDFVVRRAVINILAERKFAPACQPLAKLLAGGLDRPKASEALQKFGSVAEPAVREQLAHNDLWVRIEACRILKTIGTSDSVAALESAAHDNNPLQKRTAQEALQAIRAANRQPIEP